MKLSLTSFKKAAKRLAAELSISLAKSQELLAKTHGFASFDAATKALEPALEQSPTVTATAGIQPTWMGLSCEQTVSFLTVLALPHAATDMWQGRSQHLLKIVAKAVFASSGTLPICVDDLLHASELDELENRCWRPVEGARQSDGKDIEAYLLSVLPGYRKDRFHDQNAETEDHHRHLTAPLVFGFVQMRALEKVAPLAPEKLEVLRGLIASAPTNKIANDILVGAVRSVEFGGVFLADAKPAAVASALVSEAA